MTDDQHSTSSHVQDRRESAQRLSVHPPSWVWQRSWAESAPAWLPRAMFAAGCLFILTAAAIAVAAWTLPRGHPLLSLTALPFALIGLAMMRPWLTLLQSLRRRQKRLERVRSSEASAGPSDQPHEPTSRFGRALPLNDPGRSLIVAIALVMVGFTLPFTFLMPLNRGLMGWTMTVVLLVGAIAMCGFGWVIFRRILLSRRLHVWFAPYPLREGTTLELYLEPADLLAPPPESPPPEPLPPESPHPESPHPGSRHPESTRPKAFGPVHAEGDKPARWRVMLHCLRERWVEQGDESMPVFDVLHQVAIDPRQASSVASPQSGNGLSVMLKIPDTAGSIGGGGTDERDEDRADTPSPPDWLIEIIPPDASSQPEERFWFRMPVIGDE
ncbi:MAG: hypothetical protein JJU36_18285 [Phycisphaeraceae bacterium]|nr:hypothetical protein [Phycisphaeraceae bacterium]